MADETKKENQEVAGEEAPQKNQRERFYETLKTNYPDDNFDDDEVAFGRLNSERERYHAGEEQAKKLKDIFAKEPRYAGLFTALQDGGDPLVFMIEQFGDDFRDALENPDKVEALTEARNKWLEQTAKNKDLQAESEANMKSTLDILEELQSENELSDEQIAEVFLKANEFASGAVTNLYSKEFLQSVMKSMNYDKAVAAAADEGERRGRNEKIVEKLEAEKAPSNVPPSLGGTSAGAVTNAPKKKVYNPFAAND